MAVNVDRVAMGTAVANGDRAVVGMLREGTEALPYGDMVSRVS